MIDPFIPSRLVEAARCIGPVAEAPALEVLETLQRARKLVAGGWSEPTLDADGRWCSVDDEGVTTYSVHDALHHGSTFEAEHIAECSLAIAIDAGLTITLSAWLEAPGRKLAEVLVIFDRAISRVKAAARTEMSHVA